MLACCSRFYSTRCPTRSDKFCSRVPGPTSPRPEASRPAPLFCRHRNISSRSIGQRRNLVSAAVDAALAPPDSLTDIANREDSQSTPANGTQGSPSRAWHGREANKPTQDTGGAAAWPAETDGLRPQLEDNLPGSPRHNTHGLEQQSQGSWLAWLNPWTIIDVLFGTEAFQPLDVHEAQAGASKHVAACGRATDRGTRYGKLNQDFAITKQLPGREQTSGDVHIGAVMDGHGLLGEVSAETVGRCLECFLAERLQLCSITAMGAAELKEMFIEGFRRAHTCSHELYSSPPEVYTYPKGPSHSIRYRLKTCKGVPYYWSQQGRSVPLECGTTCTAAVLDGNTLAVAHVGDSTAVLGYTAGGRYFAEAITRDHTCRDEKEADRCRQIPEASITEKKQLRIVLQNQRHTVAMSRALGHRLLSAEYGVLTTPDVRRLQLETRHCCLIVASDGVWDNLSAHEAVRVVMQAVHGGASAEQAARELTSRAVSAAFSAGRKGGADNATAIVYILQSAH